MTRVLLGVVVSGAASAATHLVVSWLSAIAWHVADHRTKLLSPRVRAQRLAAWRLFPTAAACAAALLTLVGFFRFEPLDVRETLGLLLPTLFAAGVVSVLAGLVRAARAVRHTSKAVCAWQSQPAGIARMLPVVAVDAPFPIVAVVGIWKPRLFVARQVVARCTRSELDAMIDHEVAHVEARDNLTRLLFSGAPVVPFTSRSCRALENAWIAASEEAADDAARQDEHSALALASALVKVARMAGGRTPLVHASAILSGSGVEHRVRRLLGAGPTTRHDQRGFRWAGAVGVAVALALWQPVLRSAYELAEYCVQHLP